MYRCDRTAKTSIEASAAPMGTNTKDGAKLSLSIGRSQVHLRPVLPSLMVRLSCMCCMGGRNIPHFDVCEVPRVKVHIHSRMLFKEKQFVDRMNFQEDFFKIRPVRRKKETPQRQASDFQRSEFVLSRCATAHTSLSVCQLSADLSRKSDPEFSRVKVCTERILRVLSARFTYSSCNVQVLYVDGASTYQSLSLLPAGRIFAGSNTKYIKKYQRWNSSDTGLR